MEPLLIFIYSFRIAKIVNLGHARLSPHVARAHQREGLRKGDGNCCLSAGWWVTCELVLGDTPHVNAALWYGPEV